MRLSARARAFAIITASASLLAIPLAAPSSAAVAQPGKCTKLATKSVSGTLTATLTSCTPLTATGGKGTGTFKQATGTSGSLNITIKWAASKGTTKGTIHFANQATRGKCAVGATRIKITGKVTGGTGTAAKTFKTNQPITGSVCSGPKGITLEPGTALKF
jgi:hypothetical protein